MVCTLCDLRDKEVINVLNGKRLGYVCDAEIDCSCGRVCALLVPGPSKCLGLVRGGAIRIPWDKIDRIGDDIILVRADNFPTPGKPDGGKKRKC